MCLMILNQEKLGRIGHAVSFMKYLAHLVSSIFLPKTLTWDAMAFLASNLLKLPDLVVT